MARDGELVGSMVLSDRVRGDAAETVRQLQDRGYRTIMLTGVPQHGPLNVCKHSSSMPLILMPGKHTQNLLHSHRFGPFSRWTLLLGVRMYPDTDDFGQCP